MTTLIDNIFNTVCDLVDDFIQEYQKNAPVVPKWYTSELAQDDESNPITVKINNIRETKL